MADPTTAKHGEPVGGEHPSLAADGEQTPASCRAFLSACLSVLLSFRKTLNQNKEFTEICEATEHQINTILENADKHTHYRLLFAWPLEFRWTLQFFVERSPTISENYVSEYLRLWSILDQRFESQFLDYGVDADLTNVFPRPLQAEISQIAGQRELQQLLQQPEFAMRSRLFSPQEDPNQTLISELLRDVRNNLHALISTMSKDLKADRHVEVSILADDTLQRLQLWQSDLAAQGAEALFQTSKSAVTQSPIRESLVTDLRRRVDFLRTLTSELKSFSSPDLTEEALEVINAQIAELPYDSLLFDIQSTEKDIYSVLKEKLQDSDRPDRSQHLRTIYQEKGTPISLQIAANNYYQQFDLRNVPSFASPAQLWVGFESSEYPTSPHFEAVRILGSVFESRQNCYPMGIERTFAPVLSYSLTSFQLPNAVRESLALIYCTRNYPIHSMVMDYFDHPSRRGNAILRVRTLSAPDDYMPAVEQSHRQQLMAFGTPVESLTYIVGTMSLCDEESPQQEGLVAMLCRRRPPLSLEEDFEGNGSETPTEWISSHMECTKIGSDVYWTPRRPPWFDFSRLLHE